MSKKPEMSEQKGLGRFVYSMLPNALKDFILNNAPVSDLNAAQRSRTPEFAVSTFVLPDEESVPSDELIKERHARYQATLFTLTKHVEFQAFTPAQYLQKERSKRLSSEVTDQLRKIFFQFLNTSLDGDITKAVWGMTELLRQIENQDVKYLMIPNEDRSNSMVTISGLINDLNQAARTHGEQRYMSNYPAPIIPDEARLRKVRAVLKKNFDLDQA